MLPSPLQPGTGRLLCEGCFESDGAAEPEVWSKARHKVVSFSLERRGKDIKGGLYKREFKLEIFHNG